MHEAVHGQVHPGFPETLQLHDVVERKGNIRQLFLCADILNNRLHRLHFLLIQHDEIISEEEKAPFQAVCLIDGHKLFLGVLTAVNGEIQPAVHLCCGHLDLRALAHLHPPQFFIQIDRGHLPKRCEISADKGQDAPGIGHFPVFSPAKSQQRGLVGPDHRRLKRLSLKEALFLLFIPYPVFGTECQPIVLKGDIQGNDEGILL